VSTLRERLFEPADRHDVELASRRGLLAGLFQATLHLVAFAALFVLGLVTDVVRPGDADPTVLLFWGTVVGAAALGVGMVALATTDRVNRFWRVPAARLVTVLALYAVFWVVLVVDFATALFAGPAFVIGRIATHVWLYLSRS
jgi:energy-converting hydrogenase Eha subunit E